MTVKWIDTSGDAVVTQIVLADGYLPSAAEILAFLQDLQDSSQARIEEVWVASEVDLATITGRTATDTGPYKTVDDQAVLQVRRSDDGGLMRFTIPAPEVLIFDQTGEYAFQDIDEASALMVALIATGITEPLLGTPGDGTVTYVKGWRKGQHHG